VTMLSRLVAIVILSIPFGRWFASGEVARMTQYRALSHDALLAVLQEQHKGSLGLSYAGAFVALAIAFFLVLGLGAGIEKLARYLRTS
jgi:hypothetical protein